MSRAKELMQNFEYLLNRTPAEVYADLEFFFGPNSPLKKKPKLQLVKPERSEEATNGSTQAKEGEV